MKKLVVGLAVMLGFCMCAHQPSGTLDVVHEAPLLSGTEIL